MAGVVSVLDRLAGGGAGDPGGARRRAGTVRGAHHDRRDLPAASRSAMTGETVDGRGEHAPPAPVGQFLLGRWPSGTHASDVPALLEMFAELAEYEDLTTRAAGDRETAERSSVRPPPGRGGADRRARDTARGDRLRPLLPHLLQLPGQHGACGWRIFSCAPPTGALASAGHCWPQSRRACASGGGGRLEWAALDWNEPALRFYSTLGPARCPSGSPTASSARTSIASPPSIRGDSLRAGHRSQPGPVAPS